MSPWKEVLNYALPGQHSGRLTGTREPGRSTGPFAASGFVPQPVATDGGFTNGPAVGQPAGFFRYRAGGPDRGEPQPLGLPAETAAPFLPLASPAGMGAVGRNGPAAYPLPQAERRS